MSVLSLRATIAGLNSLLLRRSVAIVLRGIAALSLLVILAEVALSLAGPERIEVIGGPFQTEAAGSLAFVTPLGQASPLRYFFDTGGDNSGHPYRSGSAVSVNGTPLGPAHALHDDIRTGVYGQGAFSHWNDTLIFSLPKGTENAASSVLTVDYAWSLQDGILAGAAAAIAICFFLLALRKRLIDRQGYDRLALRASALIIGASGIVWALALLVALTYLVTIGVGWIDGWYLPNTAVFFYFPWTRHLATLEPFLAHMILFHAALVTLVYWTVRATPESRAAFRRQEAVWVRNFGRFGLFILIALFLFSVSATWFGIPRTQDLSGNAIAGLVPFNDASGHFTETFHSAAQGLWNDFASRRPLAAALRSLGMLLAGYQNALFLGLQAVLLAVATFVATLSVMRWRGLWAGMTFLGLSFVLVRPYLPSNLTEPFGILIAMASVPFFVRALTNDSLANKGAGFLLTCAALSVRMGNMLAIPALGLWVYLSSAPGWRSRARALAVVAGSLLIVGVLTWSLSAAFGSKAGQVGSNFAYTFCGLTHGGNWTTCDGIYAKELAAASLVDVGGDEAARAKVLYQRGAEMLLKNPLVLIHRLAENVLMFIGALPAILLQGYVGEFPNIILSIGWLVTVIVGLVRFVRGGGMLRSEKKFWLLFGMSMVGSASILFVDDGIRVLSASYPLLIMLMSSAFSTQYVGSSAALNQSSSRLTSYLRFSVVGAIILGCFAAPWLAYRQDLVGARALSAIKRAADEDIYLSSRYMAGFLVVPDGAERRKDVPTIPFSDFRQIITNSHIEQYGRVETPPPPFAVVDAPGLVANGGGLLIIPERMFLDRTTFGWKVTYTGGNNFRVVGEAQAILSVP